MDIQLYIYTSIHTYKYLGSIIVSLLLYYYYFIFIILFLLFYFYYYYIIILLLLLYWGIQYWGDFSIHMFVILHALALPYHLLHLAITVELCCSEGPPLSRTRTDVRTPTRISIFPC